ncbi:MAG: TonB protein [Ignavibacteria bacterium]|nr:MAG: TonB protein [Ignavibacteria bacterium]KAF0160739.1 MAG: TonB protein [Ignavibacteria bacterium]
MKIPISFRTIYMFVAAAVLMFLALTETKGNNVFPGDEDYAIAVEIAPAPVGGLPAIMKRATYPELAIRTRTEGKVYVLAYINESGDVDDVKIVKGIGGGCDEEAARAVKKSKFTPGQDKGVNVKTKLAIAVHFKLPS